MFLNVPLAVGPILQIPFCPSKTWPASGTQRKHPTEPFPRPDAPDCTLCSSNADREHVHERTRYVPAEEPDGIAHSTVTLLTRRPSSATSPLPHANLIYDSYQFGMAEVVIIDQNGTDLYRVWT